MMAFVVGFTARLTPSFGGSEGSLGGESVSLRRNVCTTQWNGHGCPPLILYVLLIRFENLLLPHPKKKKPNPKAVYSEAELIVVCGCVCLCLRLPFELSLPWIGFYF